VGVLQGRQLLKTHLPVGRGGTGADKLSELFERFDARKIEWPLPIRYCVNFKLRNLPFTGMNNDAYLDTLRSPSYEVRQND
jgi:hypothetical protein